MRKWSQVKSQTGWLVRCLLSCVEAFFLAVVIAGGLAAGYFVALGWHRLQDYQGWRVALFVGWVFLIIVAAAWFRRGVLATIVVTLALTVLWSMDASTDPVDDGQGLWAAGAVMIFVGTLAGSTLLTFIIAQSRKGSIKKR